MLQQLPPFTRLTPLPLRKSAPASHTEPRDGRSETASNCKGLAVNPSGTVLREFQWDAKNRLVKLTEGTQETEFVYDGKDRRVLKIERTNGSEISRTHYIWEGSSIVQSRAADASTAQRNYFSQGFQEGSNNYYYTRDHLGSIREVVASDGITIEAAYDYSPWGEVNKIGGTGAESDFLYTGHFYHGESDLHLTLYRAYNPELGMWLSRDPLQQVLGLDAEIYQVPNLYQYGFNDPINKVDNNGLWVWHAVGAGLGAAFDLGAQLATNGGNISDVNWSSVGVSAASGALGVGLGANVARITTSVTGRAVLNGIGSAGIGAAGQIVNNAADGCDLTEGVTEAAILNGSLGALGSTTGDLLERGINSLAQGTPLIEGLRNSGALSGGSTIPESLGSSLGTGVGNVISNSGPGFSQ